MDTIEPITDRQMEVARLVAEGRSNPEIADVLGVSLVGAKYHVSELLGRRQPAPQARATPAPGGWRRFRVLAPVGAVLGVVAAGVLVSVALNGGRDDTGVPVSTQPPSTSVATEPVPGDSEDSAAPEKLPLFWEYEVQPGDTPQTMAQRFGVSADTIIWNNLDLEALLAPGETNRFEPILAPGTTIRVPSVDGILHTVAEGDTVGGIAAQYGAEVQGILDVAANGLTDASDDPEPGTVILVPGGTITPGEVVTDADAGWVWPVEGDLKSAFGPEHPEGIDIRAPLETEVRAARAGQVTFAGGDPCCDHGYHVIIEHADGYETLYAHLGGGRLTSGTVVAAGDVIGTVGMTGDTDEPHLHFEIRRAEAYQDPLVLLP